MNNSDNKDAIETNDKDVVETTENIANTQGEKVGFFAKFFHKKNLKGNRNEANRGERTSLHQNFYAQSRNNLRFKTWNYFAAFICASIILAALALALLSGPSSSFLKQYEIAGTINDVKSYLYDISANEQTINNLANESNIELTVMSVENDAIDFDDIVFACNPYSIQGDTPDLVAAFSSEINDMFATSLTTQHSVVKYGLTENKDYLLYFDTYSDENVNYVVVAGTSLSTQIGTRRILLFQASALLFFVLILGVASSWSLSERLSKPIVSMSVSARKLAQGDYTVKFEGNGYNEIDELAETLNYATQKLSQTTQMRKDIVANVSHDLKTPLTLIKSYAEMLRDFPDAPANKREERLDVIIRETDRITELINQMTMLSMSETGNLPLNKEVFDLSALSKSVAESFSSKAEAENCKFTTEIQDGLEVCADKSQISQVIYNFVTNAFNYTEDKKEIRLELREINDIVRFDCFDNGVGLSDEAKDKIWDRYYRESGTYTRGQGTGLGLSIAKTILQLHEANFGVNSVLGQGSDFYFELKKHIEELPEKTIE